MNALTEKQLEELKKIEYRIAMIDGPAQDQLYLILRRLVATYPNNYDLGQAIITLTQSI
jgi:hypothetical protein